MCKIQDKYTEAKTFTGYKVALKHKKTGEYYSPSTGTVYREGRRMRPLKKNVRNICVGFQDPLKRTAFYDEKMQGKTGVFCWKAEACVVLRNVAKVLQEEANMKDYKAVLLEMTIKGGLHHAVLTYAFGQEYSTVVGSHIVSIKQILLHRNHRHNNPR